MYKLMNRLRTLMRRAKFPYNKTLEQFNFSVHPELRRKVFQTHLSISIGIRAVQNLVNKILEPVSLKEKHRILRPANS